jgi:coniferyl-aldehyde dehydrogenase
MSSAPREIFEKQRAAFARDPAPSYQTRIHRLRTLAQVISRNREAIASAIDADYGGRSWHESMLLDVFGPLSLIRYTMRHLRRWMQPQRRHVELYLQPARAEVHQQPKGVVGIIAPWNYPVYLSVGPLCAAIAAGNRAMLKLSELTPRTAAVLKTVLSEVFDENLIAVLAVDKATGQELSWLPLDHILFTGSSAAAKAILKAAAENLTPVTLELGGKSPLLIHAEYDPVRAVKRIAVGKFVNAGQTCVAPDYVMVHAGKLERLVAALQNEIAREFPHIGDNPDYTAIINQRHRTRLEDLLADAQAKGATVVEAGQSNGSSMHRRPEARKLAPTLVINATERMRVMQEEIFGPVLPIVTYGELEEAIEFLNRQARPLAFFYFDDNAARARKVLARTVSGGACVNEVGLHVLEPDLPFGGIGPSGMGAYHAKAGFDTFSHQRSVFVRGRLNPANLFIPPYGKMFERALRLLIGSRG